MKRQFGLVICIFVFGYIGLVLVFRRAPLPEKFDTALAERLLWHVEDVTERDDYRMKQANDRYFTFWLRPVNGVWLGDDLTTTFKNDIPSDWRKLADGTATFKISFGSDGDFSVTPANPEVAQVELPDVDHLDPVGKDMIVRTQVPEEQIAPPLWYLDNISSDDSQSGMVDRTKVTIWLRPAEGNPRQKGIIVTYDHVIPPKWVPYSYGREEFAVSYAGKRLEDDGLQEEWSNVSPVRYHPGPKFVPFHAR